MKSVPQISASEAAALVKDGDVLLGGGFGMTGNPIHLLHALAMDLASGAKKLIITLMHNDPDGTSKIVPSCTLPLTAMGAVDVVITDLAVFIYDQGLVLTELMPGVTLEEVKTKTKATFEERLRSRA